MVNLILFVGTIVFYLLSIPFILNKIPRGDNRFKDGVFFGVLLVCLMFIPISIWPKWELDPMLFGPHSLNKFIAWVGIIIAIPSCMCIMNKCWKGFVVE